MKDPLIAVAVIAEHACHGGSSAAPVARAVIKTYLEKYYPELYGEKAVAARLKAQRPAAQPSASPRRPLAPSADDEDVVTNADNPILPADQHSARRPRRSAPMAGSSLARRAKSRASSRRRR